MFELKVFIGFNSPLKSAPGVFPLFIYTLLPWAVRALCFLAEIEAACRIVYDWSFESLICEDLPDMC